MVLGVKLSETKKKTFSMIIFKLYNSGLDKLESHFDMCEYKCFVIEFCLLCTVLNKIDVTRRLLRYFDFNKNAEHPVMKLNDDSQELDMSTSCESSCISYNLHMLSYLSCRFCTAVSTSSSKSKTGNLISILT
ncbi:hypothetical protein T11_4362 [Trichinella zimbabwensis]|uniref:Uncharacterized protein n=1 Tax=Trichinella zimbabwensis TaxID=268475 RepID=A0A0V1HMR2_9BILA|nr:hypothetical protein T11_4362 [Trichinella zimbabwensis]